MKRSVYRWSVDRQIVSGTVVALSVSVAGLVFGWKVFAIGAAIALITRFSDWLEWRYEIARGLEDEVGRELAADHEQQKAAWD